MRRPAPRKPSPTIRADEMQRRTSCVFSYGCEAAAKIEDAHAHGSRRLALLVPSRSLWSGCPFDRVEPANGLGARAPAHLVARPQRAAHRWSVRVAENLTPFVVAQLNASYARSFSPGHAGDGTRYRGSNAACPTVRTTVHQSVNRRQSSHQGFDGFVHSMLSGVIGKRFRGMRSAPVCLRAHGIPMRGHAAW